MFQRTIFALSMFLAFCFFAGCFSLSNISSPAIDAEGTIYCGLVHGVAAFHPNGNLKWKRQINGIANAPVTIGPMLYSWSAAFWSHDSSNSTAEYCCVYWGSTIPPSSSQVDDYHHMMSAGVGCYEISDFVDPNFDYTPGDNFYHPQNSVIATGASDGTEMGCFGGTDGD